MKPTFSTLSFAPRRGSILGLLVLFLTSAMLGGADPVIQVEQARTALGEVNAVVQSEIDDMAELARDAADAPPSADASDTPAPEAEPGEGEEYVPFSDAAKEMGAQMESPETGGSDRITVTLDDVTLEDTVRLFSQTAGANIIVSGALIEGKRVTANLQGVAWRPAMAAILEVHDLELVERSTGSGVYSVQMRLPNAPEPTHVRTFPLRFTTTAEIRGAITSMLRPNAVLTTFPSRNVVVVRSTEANLGEIAELVDKLDIPGRQVLIEAKIMELSDDAAKQLGIHWGSLAAFGVRAKVDPFSWRQSSTDTRTTSRGVSRSDQSLQDTLESDVHDRVNTIVDHSFQGSSQVGTYRDFMIPTDEGPVISSGGGSNPDQIGGTGGAYSTRSYSTGEEAFSYGGQYSDYDSLGTDTRTRTSSSLSQRSIQATAGSTVLDEFSRVISMDQGAILEMDTLEVVLSALETMDGVSIVSNPKIVVASGSTNAFFSVGDREPIIRTEIQRGTAESPGDKETANLDTSINTEFIRDGYLQTGIDLRVVATVKTEDQIEANINPSLRRKVGEKTVGGNSWPIITVKEIGTRFTLRSGQTVAIGGLTDTRDSKEVARVPFLGRIPIIGRLLFTHEREVKRQTETIIFVTLSVADPEGLEDHAGIPENAHLVHKRRLQEQIQMSEKQAELEAQIDAMNQKLAETQAAISTAETDEEEAVEPEAAEEPNAEAVEEGTPTTAYAIIRESEEILDGE